MATLNEETKDCKLLQRLQTYVPFLKDMIDNRLKADMPQYKKIVALHDMITDRKRKFRYETLKKCEEVIIKMQTKTNYRHAKTDIGKVTPRSPSPVREVVMTDAIPTIRSPDPESWNSLIDQDSVTSDRYTNEKPSVYSTAAETVGRPKSIFDRLGSIVPDLDTSKPPISVADLKLLQEDDSIPGASEDSKSYDNEPTNFCHIKPPSKVSLVPTPLNKHKHIRVAPPIERKPSIVEKKEKIVSSTDSVFGSLLSSLDEKILVDQKKRRNSRDGFKMESDKIKINLLMDKVKSPPISSVKRETPVDDFTLKTMAKKTLEEPVKSVSEDDEKQTRLAFKYKPKPKKRNDEIPKIDLVNQIIKEMDKSVTEEIKIPFLESPEPIVQKTEFEFQNPPELTPEPMALESSFSSGENNSMRFSPPPLPPPAQVWEPPPVFPSAVPPALDYQFHNQSPNQFATQSPSQFVPPSPNPFSGQGPNYNFQPRTFPFRNPIATPNIFNNRFQQRPPFVRPQMQAPGRAFTPYEPIKSEYEDHTQDFYHKPQHSFAATKRGNFHHGNFDRGRFNFRENEPHMTYKSWREGKESRDPRLCRRDEDSKEDESRFIRAKSRERDHNDIRLNRAKSRDRFEEDKGEEKSRDPRFNRAKSRDRFDDKDDSRFERSISRNRFERAKSRDRFDDSKFDRSRSRDRSDSDRFSRAKSRDRSQSPDRRREKSLSRDESKSFDSRKDRRRSPTNRDSRSPPKSKPRSRYDKSHSSRNSERLGSPTDRVYKDKTDSNLKNFKIPKKHKPEEIIAIADESSNSSQSSGPVAADSTLNPPSPKPFEAETLSSTLETQDKKCEPESTTSNEPEKKTESEQVAKDVMLDMLKTKVGGISPTELQKFMTMFTQMFSGLIAGKDIASLVAEFAAPKTESSETIEVNEEETPKIIDPKDQAAQEEPKNEEEEIEKNNSDKKVLPVKKNKTKLVVVKKKPGPKPKPKSAVKHINLQTRSSVAERIKNMKRKKKSAPTPAKRPRRSELDKLHQDIKETMGDEVLSTAPKRSCTIHNEVAPAIEASNILEKGRSLRVVLQKIDVRRPKRGLDLIRSPETSPPLKRKSLTKAAEAISSMIDTIDSPEEEESKKEDAEIETDLSDVVAESESEVSVTEKIEEEIETELDNKGKKKKRKSKSWASGFIKKKKIKTKADEIPTVSQQHVTEEAHPLDDSTTPVTSSDLVAYIDPDKNYYLKFKAHNECKLCKFRGTNIIYHYVMSHPESDVAISRLSPEATETALKSADDENLSFYEPQPYSRKHKRYNFACRFCNVTLIGITNDNFYDHLSMHTGEYRNKCNFCPFKNNNRKNLVRHIENKHSNEKLEKIGDGIIKEKGSGDGNIVLGFVCSECNFLQLKKASVEEHVQIYHLSKSACVRMINMSAPIDENPTKQIQLAGVDAEEDASTTSESTETEPVKLEESDTPIIAKDPDLTVFMCNNDIVKEDENVMEKRLEKMNEIQESIKMQRTSFVDKLQSRLETEQESSSPVIEPVQEQPKVEAITKDITTPIPVLEEVANDLPALIPKSKERQAVEPIKLPESTTPKTDIVGSIVNRLQDQLSKQTPPSTPETVQPNKGNIVSAYNMEAVLEPGKAPMFVCKNPVCIFKTETRNIFEKHCSLTHKSEQNLLSCYSCDDKRTLPMIEIFKHMCLHVDDELKKAEVTSPIVLSNQSDDLPPVMPEITPPESTTENMVTETEPREAKYSFKITNVQSLAPPKDQSTVLPVLPELPPLIPLSSSVSMSNVSPSIVAVPKTITVTATQKQPEPQFLLVATPGTKFVVSKPPAITKIVPLTANECKKMRKSGNVLEQWLAPDSLEMPFKCPSFVCSFATHSETEYDVHITTHIFDEYIPCLYCNYKMKIESMKNHVLMRHVHCSYGCAYCLYRAVSADYIQIHQETLHQGKAIKTVKFTMKESVRRVASPPPPLIRNVLKPYKCKCGKELIIKDNYEQHIVQCRQARNGPYFACSVCSVLTKRVRTVTQHFTTHGIFEYHCRYCPFGGLQAKDVLNHIALQHPHQYAVIIWRQLQKSAENQGHEEDDTIFDQLCIIQDNYEKSEPATSRSSPVIKTPLLLSPTSLALITTSTSQPIILNSTLIPVTRTHPSSTAPAVTPSISHVPLTNSPTLHSSPSTPPPIIQIPSSTDITNKVLAALSPEKVGVEEKVNLDFTFDDSDDFTVDAASEGPKMSGLIGKDLFKCNSCKNTFGNTNLFKTHLLKCIKPEGKPRPYICIHCSKCFKTAANLADHIRIHGTQRFGCSLCSYKHSHPWHLSDQCTHKSSNDIRCDDNDWNDSKVTDPKEPLDKEFLELQNFLDNNFDNNVQVDVKFEDDDFTKSVENNIPSNICQANIVTNSITLEDFDTIDNLSDRNITKSSIDICCDDNDWDGSKMTDPKEPLEKEFFELQNFLDDNFDNNVRVDVEFEANDCTKSFGNNIPSNICEPNIVTNSITIENLGTVDDLSDRNIRSENAEEDEEEEIDVLNVSDTESNIDSVAIHHLSDINERTENTSFVEEEENVDVLNVSDVESNIDVETFDESDFKEKIYLKKCLSRRSKESLRRDDIKNKLFSLALLVPELQKSKFTTQNVLKESVRYIAILKTENDLLRKELEKEQHHCRYLRIKLDTLRNLMTHMKTKHKITNCNIVPVEPGKKNMDTDEFLARPSLQRRTSTVDSPAKESSVDLAVTALPNIKTHYLPAEANELPPKSIYSTEVFCRVCNFGTKVRMNLVRHFGLHLNNESISIPATAPVNPVPCLEKNELMFDKMTNLALSSHSSGRMGFKTEKNITIEPVETSVPVFVPSNKRYVCGANNCNYLCLEESMLRHHLQALHMQEKTYICSHCKDNLSTDKGNINVDAILSHLRFHDAVLYMCGYCKMLSTVKAKLEKHTFEKHPDLPQNVITVREQETETEVVASVEKPEKEKKRPWRCGMCKGKFSGRTEAAFHAESKHGINSQYKCSFCDYKSDNKETFREHFDSTHKGYSLDMIVVFYKEESEAKLSDAEPSDLFDTTPLWVRNKANVKHIRGILLDQHEKLPKKSPIKLAPFTTFEKKASPIKTTVSNLDLSIDAVAKGSGVPPKKPGRRPKKPDPPKLDIVTSTTSSTLLPDKPDMLSAKQNNTTHPTDQTMIPAASVKEEKLENSDIIEIPDSPTKELTVPVKISKNRKNIATEDLTFADLQKMPVRKLLDGNFMGTYGPYGKPNKTKFFCPLCASFEHKTSVVFENHLCEELKYERYICNLCEFKSVTGKMLQKHFYTTHNNQKMVHIKPLEPNLQIEDWIRKQILYQERLINHYVLKAGGKITVKSEDEPSKTSKLSEEKSEIGGTGSGNCGNGSAETSKDEPLLVPMSTEEVKISKPASKKKCNYFRCTPCNLTFMTRALLTNHSLKEHPQMNIADVEKFHCPKCPAMFQKSWTLQIHLRKKHPETPIVTKLTARKSTSAFKPVIRTVARKSTTQVSITGQQSPQSVSYYNCKPDITDEELKRVHTTVPVMNNYLTMNIVQLSKLFDLFPSVNVVDCKDEL